MRPLIATGNLPLVRGDLTSITATHKDLLDLRMMLRLTNNVTTIGLDKRNEQYSRKLLGRQVFVGIVNLIRSPCKRTALCSACFYDCEEAHSS